MEDINEEINKVRRKAERYRQHNEFIESSKILILFDLHGTVVCETSDKHKVPSSPSLRRDCVVYKRPYLKELFESLEKSGYIIGIYSSAMYKTLQHMLCNVIPEIDNHVSYLFHRKFNKLDSNSSKSWDTMRNISTIWKLFPQFHAKNTILIDNEERKIREYPFNAILIENYLSHRVLLQLENHYLLDLLNYLNQLSTQFNHHHHHHHLVQDCSEDEGEIIKIETNDGDVRVLLNSSPFNEITRLLYLENQNLFNGIKNNDIPLNSNNTPIQYLDDYKQAKRKKEKSGKSVNK